MKKPDTKNFLKPQPHPLIASLPDNLKNPANFPKIQAAIAKTIYTTCGHSDVSEWVKCDKCSKKMVERRKLLKSLGFKNPAQYMAWRKIHEQIISRFPLVDWEKENLRNA